MAASNKPPVPEEASKSATMTKDEIADLLLDVGFERGSVVVNG